MKLFDGKLRRESVVDGIVYDDLSFVNCCLLAVARTTESSLQETYNTITKQISLRKLCKDAPCDHQFPFDVRIQEMIDDYVHKLVVHRPNFIKSWDDSGIFSRLFVNLWLATGTSIDTVAREVYNSELSTLLVDKKNAWCITPSEEVLYYSFDYLGWQRPQEVEDLARRD